MKKRISLLMYLLLCALLVNAGIMAGSKKALADTVVWDGSVAKQFAGGDGSEADPYQISNGAQLAYMAELYNIPWGEKPSYHFVLTQNIQLNDTDNWKQWGKTPPVNKWEDAGKFQGVFDGSGYIITGLYAENNEAGFFYSVEKDGIVKNLGIEKSYMKSSGAIAGALNGGVIDNCYSSATIAGDMEKIGGLVGHNGGGTIKNSYNLGTVAVPAKNYSYDKYFYVGGIAGVNYGTIINCYNKGTVSAGGQKRKKEGTRIYVQGGIAGYSYNKIESSTNYANIYSKDKESYVGGITGELYNGSLIKCSNKGKIERKSGGGGTGGIAGTMYIGKMVDCTNKGEIQAAEQSRYVGGILGVQKNYDKDSEIENCVNSGKISAGKGSTEIGGIAGKYDSKIISCINKSNIKAGEESSRIAGIVGFTSQASIINCINMGGVTAPKSSNVGGITGLLGVWVIMSDNEDSQIDAVIINCANTGNISSKSGGLVGGIAGEAYDRIYNSYNTGDITGDNLVGGILGMHGGLSGNKTPVNCYYRKDSVHTKGIKDKNGTVLTASQMKSTVLTKKLNDWVKKKGKKTYKVWITGAKENKGYPYFKK